MKKSIAKKNVSVLHSFKKNNNIPTGLFAIATNLFVDFIYLFQFNILILLAVALPTKIKSCWSFINENAIIFFTIKDSVRWDWILTKQ